jgi:adenylosuccinate synthase
MNHVIVVDLGFGDAGKGSVVDWICSPGFGGPGFGGRPVRAVVRFNGGAQAAHNVVTADGRHHTFAQFGSGTFTPGVRTHLSRFMLVDPLALAAEATHLAVAGVGDALDRLTVDRDALLTTPYHRAANRARERARGDARHGSCGAGIGETARYALEYPGDAPRAADCASFALARKLRRLRDRVADEFGFLAGPDVADVCDACRAFAERVALVDGGYLARLLRAGPVVFEGAQGVLLDEWRGFHPYTTWSTTTFDNAQTLLADAGSRDSALRLGVARCYLTRHGPGPFVTEDPALRVREPHNQHGTWQGAFRTGHFDAVALRYAVEVSGGVDAVALTHLDAAARHPLRVCRSYQVGGRPYPRIIPGPERDLRYAERLTAMLLGARPVYENPGPDWPETVEDALGVPVVLTSHGPTAADKHETVRRIGCGSSMSRTGTGSTIPGWERRSRTRELSSSGKAGDRSVSCSLS